MAPETKNTKMKTQDDTKNKPNLPQVLGSQMKDSWRKKSGESSQAAKPRISKEKKSGKASQTAKQSIPKLKITLGSKTGDCQKNKTEADCSDLHTDSPSDEMRKRSLQSSSESEQVPSSGVDKEEEETSKPEESSDQKESGEKKRKRRRKKPGNERPAKSKRLLIVDETLPTSEDASENNSKPSGK